jgi:hypothetical protein
VTTVFRIGAFILVVFLLSQCGGPTPTWPTVAGGKGPLLTAPDKQLSVGKGPLLSVPKLPGEIPCGRRFAI